MLFIEKTDCKLCVSKWQCECPQYLQNIKHVPTSVRFCCLLFALQLNKVKITVGARGN